MTSKVEKIFNEAIQLYNQGKHKKAFELFSKAADQGHKDAQHALSCMQHIGKGVKQDKQTAIDNLLILADQGHNRSIEVLKRLLRNDC